MAMPDDISDDLDLLRRVFPKWQGDDILHFLMKTPAEDRVKRAVCKYIRSHDASFNRNDCEADAKLVHEIFPDVPLAHIFKQLTIFGDESNRVRICLRLLLSENGFKTSSISDFEIDSQEIKETVKNHKAVVDSMESTLASLNNIRNKYEHSNCEKSANKISSIFLPFDSDRGSVIVKACDKVVLSESPNSETVESMPATSEEMSENQFAESSNLTESSEIVDESTCSKKENIVCTNPFDVTTKTINTDKQVLVDLTLKRGGKPYDLYNIQPDEVINLDTQEINPDVIIEDKPIPEPIPIKLRKIAVKTSISPDKTEQKVEENIASIAGPSGINFPKRKGKFLLQKEDDPSSKKLKMNHSIISIIDESDDGKSERLKLEESDNPKRHRDSILMYDDLIDRKKRDSTAAGVLSNSQDFEETVFEFDSLEEAEEEEEGEIYDIDNGLYFPLMEIFPEACPKFLKQLCNGKHNKGSELDRLISEVLDRPDYPRRKRQDESQVNVFLTTDDQLEILTQVLPDADPMYLKKHIEACNNCPEGIKQFINEAVESKNYPTLKEYQRKQQLSTQSKQYTSGFNIEKFLEQIPDPKNYFKKKKYEMFSYEEHDYLLSSLKNVFHMLPLKRIRDTIKQSRSVTQIFDQLQENSNNELYRLKLNRKKGPCDTVVQNIPFLQEVAFNVHKKEILSYQNDRKQLLKQQRDEHRAAGALITCGCCYDDELLPAEVVACDLGCVVCKGCVQRSTEVAFGEAKTTFPCVGGCESTYSMKLLQDALTKKLFSKVAQKQQLAEVRAAGLEDLEQCPFCDFAHIPTAEDRLFRCFNPECMKESCRKCKEPNHIPLRCEEVEKDADVKARTAIEDRMTEALVRTCWQCKTKFIKADGCNKMTCPKCGAFSCYVCGQAVKDYKHFNGQGGDRTDLCPLYSDTNKLHEEAVRKAAVEAKKTVDPTALKHDPTSDLEKHFEDYNKKNPIVLPPGVQVQQNAGRAAYPYPPPLLPPPMMHMDVGDILLNAHDRLHDRLHHQQHHQQQQQRNHGGHRNQRDANRHHADQHRHRHRAGPPPHAQRPLPPYPPPPLPWADNHMPQANGAGYRNDNQQYNRHRVEPQAAHGRRDIPPPQIQNRPPQMPPNVQAYRDYFGMP